MEKNSQKRNQENKLQRDMMCASIRQNSEEENVFELSFSSETPVERWFGREYLSHDPEAVDLERINNLGVFLFNHNRDKVVGKIRKAWIEDRRGKAEIEFDNDDFSQVIRDKVANETLRGVSVGYCVTRYEELKAGEKSSDGRFEGPGRVATRWFPYEISTVSIPADDTVGVGREMREEQGTQTKLRYYEAMLQVNINKSL